MSLDADTLARLRRALAHRPEQGLAIVLRSDLQKVLDALQEKGL